MKLLRGVIALPVLLALMLSQSSVALAASYTLFGDASLVHPGNASDTAAQLRSVGTSFGGVDFDVPSGTTVGQLTNLATDYKFTSGSCGGGAPRFQINTTQGNIFVYIGPPPNYTLCPPNVWATTGNLLLLPVDSSQLPGGTFYDSWAHVLAAYGSLAVTGIQLVTDGGWSVGGTQTVLVDNVQINDMLFTFEAEPTKDSCKDGGWEDFTSSPGPFKNQGDCVSYFASGGKN
jgi:hypothetical protein